MSLVHSHQLNKPLSGPNGYKRLARLVVRSFYSGECPPNEPEEEGQPAPFRSRLIKHAFPGLGVLVVDLLTSQDGYVDEEAICRHLRLSQKNVRKALRYLEGEHLLSYQDLILKKPRKPREEMANGSGSKVKAKAGEAQQGGSNSTAGAAAAAGNPDGGQAGAKKGFKAAKGAAVPPDEEAEEVPMRKETKVFWCMDYPRLRDSLLLRLYRVREFLKEQVQDKNPLQDYLCPTCGARYSSLDAIRLLDPMQGIFRCEECRGELVQHVEGGKSMGEDRKSTVAKYKDLQSQFEAQLKPITDQLERLKEVEPPDYGSLQDWLAEQAAARARKAKRDANAAQRAAAAAAAGGEAVPLEWVDNAEVQVNFGGGPVAVAAAAEAGKELPAWFRTGQQASGIAGSNTTSDATVEPSTANDGAPPQGPPPAAVSVDADRERERQIQEAYLAQYLADVARAKAAHAGASGASLDDKKDVKRIKTEAGWASASEAKLEPEPKPELQLAAQPEVPAAAVGGWEGIQQAQEQQQAQQQQQQQQLQQPPLDVDVGEWEDVEAKQEAGAGVGSNGHAAAAGAIDDDFEWEDA